MNMKLGKIPACAQNLFNEMSEKDLIVWDLIFTKVFPWESFLWFFFPPRVQTIKINQITSLSVSFLCSCNSTWLEWGNDNKIYMFLEQGKVRTELLKRFSICLDTWRWKSNAVNISGHLICCRTVLDKSINFLFLIKLLVLQSIFLIMEGTNSDSDVSIFHVFCAKLVMDQCLMFFCAN